MVLKIEEDEVNGALRMHDREEKCTQNFVWRT
jgi:hypothetical protein